MGFISGGVSDESFLGLGLAGAAGGAAVRGVRGAGVDEDLG